MATLALAWAAMAHAQPPTPEEAAATLRRAVHFYCTQAAAYGGYVYRYSGDLTLREGEGQATETMAWVQPPGTPAVGEAFLDAHEATGDVLHLSAAVAAGDALVRGQLRSGGWDHVMEFDESERARYAYRDQPIRKKQEGQTSLDDDISQSAARFLCRLDGALGLRVAKVHEAALFCLEAMLRAQYPNGGWYQWWDEYPEPTTEADFPILQASYPETWSRVWLNDWPARYFINDRVPCNMLRTMLRAHEVYGDQRYLDCAEKAGGFLLLAQMPDPQPAWAQQYDEKMRPVWDRKFEPPAITAFESQDVMESLILLFRATGDRKYLEPIPRALAYLRTCLLPDGRLARFYELQTNRPLYFRRTGTKYDLTYDPKDAPDHYAFTVDSRLDAIEADYQRALAGEQAARGDHLTPELEQEARRIIDGLDDRGAWVEDGILDHHNEKPESGVIDSGTFARNVGVLCRFIRARR